MSAYCRLKDKKKKDNVFQTNTEWYRGQHLKIFKHLVKLLKSSFRIEHQISLWG